MNVLLTGAFGNIGTSTIAELVRQGHAVRCFDVRTHKNRRTAARLCRTCPGQVEVVWGDLRQPADLADVLRDQDVVVHLAFIIPKMSATGVESEKRPGWAYEINVGGTRNLLDAMRAQPRPPRILFISSYHVYGRTQDQPPPRTILDPVSPLEHYSHHKVLCERMILTSGLEWCIFRLAAALPFAIHLDPGMFDVPLDNRMEFVDSRDVGLAVANAVAREDIWGRLLLIGGGPRCQYYFREIVGRVLDAVGVGKLPEEAFGTTPFCTDWIDTTESERLLQYQRRDLGDYIQEMSACLGFRRLLVRLFRPWVRQWLLGHSPYYRLRAADALQREAGPSGAADPASLELTPAVRTFLIETADVLRGKSKRLFMARTVRALGKDGEQRAERELGWARDLIVRALLERGKSPA